MVIGRQNAVRPPNCWNRVSQESLVPDHYPPEYAQLIEGSRSEGGTLSIYSNTDQENWAPILRGFQKKYPWVTDVQANNLDSDEVFQRVLSEQATGGSPADVLVSNAVQAWAEYAGQPGRLAAYQSPELAKLPGFAQVMPNVYMMSADPMTIAYNTSLLEQAPTSLADLVATTKAVPLAEGADEIFHPGEIETRAEARGRVDGVDLPAKTLAELHQLAADCGVALDLPHPEASTPP